MGGRGRQFLSFGNALDGCVECCKHSRLCIDTGYHIDEDTYNKYLRHIPKDILEGFTIKDVYDWEPQDVISWVSPQIHVAGAMDLGWTKTGVTVWIAHKE